MKRLRRIGLPLLFAGLLAALAGQYYFSQVRDRFWDGVFFYAIAALCFLRLITLRPATPGEEPPSFWPRLWQTTKDHFARVWALAIAVLCAYMAMRLNEGGKNLPAVVFWLLAIVAGVGMWVGLRQEPAEVQPKGHGETPPGEERLFQGVRAPFENWELLVVVGCTVLALLLRLVRLGTVPYVLSGDEASMGIEAVNVLEGRLTNPFATGWLSHPTLYFFMLAGSIRLLGQNIWGLRFLSPFVGTAAVPVLYLLARRLFTRRVALAAMVLLTFSHLSIHFSRLGINNIYDPLFGLAAFFFLIRGLQEGRMLDFALSGVALSLAQFFYMGARLLPVMVGVFLVLWWLLQPNGRKIWLPLTAMGSSFLLSGAPLYRFFLTHWDDFSARIKIVGIIQSGWLESEAQKTGLSTVALLWEQLRKSLLAFNYTLDPTSWYAAKIPYLDFVSGILFVLGLVVVLRRWRRLGALLVNVWFLLCLFVGGMLVENPPSSPRFVIFMPAVVLIAALGLVALLDAAGQLVKIPRPWLNRALLVVLLIAALLNVGYYFLDYTPAGLFGGLNTEVGTRVGEYLSEQEPGSQVYFFGPTRMWVHYATIPYLAPGMELADVEQPMSAPVTLTLGLEDTFFIFLPERAGELTWVQATYPQGAVQTYYGHEKTALFVVYRVSSE
jgi:4-amino-4-deoxy-L-arabinose transferase-like glycosyltransferase